MRTSSLLLEFLLAILIFKFLFVFFFIGGRVIYAHRLSLYAYVALWTIVTLNNYLRAILELIVHPLVDDPSCEPGPYELVVMTIDYEFAHYQ